MSFPGVVELIIVLIVFPIFFIWYGLVCYGLWHVGRWFWKKLLKRKSGV